MKKLIACYLIILSIISCSTGSKNSDNNPQKVVISGKVLNFNYEWQKISLSVNRIGFSQQKIEVPLDGQGNFSASFDSYIPTDVWVSYRNIFLILTHPGDSIYVEFDGALKEKAAILETVIFGGDNIKSNQDATTFQKMYFSDPQNTTDSINKAYKSLDIDQFCNYLDSSRKNLDILYESFVSEAKPNKETKIWASEFLYNFVNDRIIYYPFLHQSLNNLAYEDNLMDMPADLFSPIIERESISKSMFISGAAVTNYFRDFIMVYKQLNNLYIRRSKVPVNSVTRNSLDSLTVYGLLNCSNDNLFKQLVLTTLFSQGFSMDFNIEFFEKYRNILEKYIQEPFLREPLFELYRKYKQEHESQISSYEAMQKEAASLNENQMLDSIISSNKGKVIYLDCWATWCGPCRAEMPNSKTLMEELHGRNVVFAFLCLHSYKKDWQSMIEKLHIGGQHYFLPKDQSIDFAKFYAINGVPNYMLIDKQGKIVEQGTHLRPDLVKEKIEKLLKE